VNELAVCLSCHKDIPQEALPLCWDCLKARKGLTHPRWFDTRYWSELRIAARAISNASEARYDLKRKQQSSRFVTEEVPA
jgi:hypothetical protein